MLRSNVIAHLSILGKKNKRLRIPLHVERSEITGSSSLLILALLNLKQGHKPLYTRRKKKCRVTYKVSSKGYNVILHYIHRGYLFCSVKDRNLFHRVDTIGNIFTSGTSVRSKNIFTDISRYPTGKHEINIAYFMYPAFFFFFSILVYNEFSEIALHRSSELTYTDQFRYSECRWLAAK